MHSFVLNGEVMLREPIFIFNFQMGKLTFSSILFVLCVSADLKCDNQPVAHWMLLHILECYARCKNPSVSHLAY